MARLIRSLLVSMLVLGLSLELARPAWAASVLDQQQPTIDTSAGFMIAIGGGGSDQKLAQVVTPGLTGDLTQVDLALGCRSDLTIQIRGVSGGRPNDVVLGTFVTTAPGSSTTFRSFVLPSPVAVTAGVQYAIVLSSTGPCAIWPGPVGDPYPGGNAFFDSRPNPPGIWAPLGLGHGRVDLPFRTFVDPSATIGDLIMAVRRLRLDRGIENSLIVKLEHAQRAADVGDRARTCGLVDTFARELSAQSGKKITAGDAAALSDLAAKVKTTLGC